jgi:hypothetical protein
MYIKLKVQILDSHLKKKQKSNCEALKAIVGNHPDAARFDDLFFNGHFFIIIIKSHFL